MIAMNTKSGIRWLQEDPNQVKLPNGRKIGVASKEGAHEFVDAVGTDFISTNLTAANDEELTAAYFFMLLVDSNASPEKIDVGFPESEFLIFIEHTKATLQTLSTDRDWLRSGTVSMCHELMLQTAAVFTRHPSFHALFLSNKGMEAVVKFHASRKKNDTPNNEVARSVLLLFNNAIFVFTEEDTRYEKAFGILEKSGILGQFIRCIHVDPEFAAPIVAGLQGCPQLVKKKLKSGTPTGDILDAVIAGKDGPINEKVKAELAKIQTLARLSNNNYDKMRAGLKICRHCEKCETLDGTKLMKCQRCKVTYYCNRACQVADWKKHKELCNEMGNTNSKSVFTIKTSQATMWVFVESNYFDIVKEVYKKTQEYNVPKKELLVEIDFFRDAPALRNEFKV
jgi:hypothetical protein